MWDWGFLSHFVTSSNNMSKFSPSPEREVTFASRSGDVYLYCPAVPHITKVLKELHVPKFSLHCAASQERTSSILGIQSGCETMGNRREKLSLIFSRQNGVVMAAQQ